MAKILEARLTQEFLGPVGIPGKIHSKFHRVLNVHFRMPSGESRLVTVITEGTAGIPDSITVDREYFSKLLSLPVGSALQCKNMILRFDAISEPLEGGRQCLKGSEFLLKSTASGGKSVPENRSFNGFARFDEALRQLAADGCRSDGLSALGARRKREAVSGLQAFAKSWTEHDTSGMEAALLKYVGLGIGLTPTCDDAFLGIIAVYSGARLWAQEAQEQAGENLLKWRKLPDIGSLLPFRDLLFRRTTDVSLKYLCCAQEGRFSDPVIRLMDAIFFDMDECLEACVKRVSQVGESSGMDLLLGAEIACRVLWENRGFDSENQTKTGR